MISIFSNDESPDAAQPIPVPGPKLVVSQPASQTASQPGSQAAYSTAQHPAISKTVAPPAAPAPEKHGIFSWLSIGKAKKRLQMLETVSLGEKRFVALVQVDGRQFLIGGAPSNVGMIAELAPEESFHQVLRDATQDMNELPALQASPAPTNVAPAMIAETVAPVAYPQPAAPSPGPVAATPLANPAPVEAFAQTVAPAPPAPAPIPEAIAAPIAAFAQPATTAPAAAVVSPLAAPIAAPAAEAAAARPITTEAVAPVPQPAPQPVHHISVAPFALAEAVVAAGATFSPAPAAPVKPSLPPHVAARLAEMQAAIDAAPAPTASLIPDDLSLEEPVSLSPSLLAAMQQRARAALLNIEPQMPEPVVATASAQQLEPVMQEAAPAPAPSFTFQFTPMLTSTTQAVRMPKLQGAA